MLADGDDERARDAARYLDRERLANPVILDDPASFCSPAVKAQAAISPRAEKIDLGDSPPVQGLQRRRHHHRGRDFCLSGR